MRFCIALPLLLLLLTACGTIATPAPTPTLTPRSVAITIHEDPQGTATPSFNPTFDLVANIYRDGEGLQIWTDQAHFWEPGDTVVSLQSQPIELTIDDQTFQRADLFIFWRNGSIQERFDDEGNVIGSHMGAPMVISKSTRDFVPGLHSATIRITSTSGIVYSQTWQFTIEETLPA